MVEVATMGWQIDARQAASTAVRVHVANDSNNIEWCTPARFIELAQAAKDCMDKTQLGRRNLTKDQRSLLRGRRYNRTKKPAHGNSGGKNQHTGLESQSDTQATVAAKPTDTAQALADEHGVSRPTIIRDGQKAAAVAVLAVIEPEQAKVARQLQVAK